MNYRQNLFLRLVLASFFIFITGCSVTLELSSTIPFQTQQLIKSIKSDNGIQFQYISNSKGDNVKIRGQQFSINKPLGSLLFELVQTKFGNTNAISKDSIIITLENIESTVRKIGLFEDLSGPDYSLYITVGIKLTKDNKVVSNSFRYNCTGTYNNAKNDIDNFLLKYVITIDKYIDSRYIIQ